MSDNWHLPAMSVTRSHLTLDNAVQICCRATEGWDWLQARLRTRLSPVIEFLQPLVDAVAKALPAIAKKKDRDASAKLGAELFLVYVQFNEALVLAEEIVQSLEHYVDRMTNHLRTGEDKYVLAAGEWFSDSIHEQLRNLEGIRNRIDGWKWELQVLDGKSTNDLRFLLSRKMSALRALADTIENEHLPLRTSGVLIDDQGTLRSLADRPAHDLFARYGELAKELTANSVPMNEPWGPKILAIVEGYLASRKPRQQLDEIRDSLEKIKVTLEANFTIGDILFRAGDPRAGRDRH